MRDSQTDLQVTWRAPANTARPAITHYALQYRQGTSGPWIDDSPARPGPAARLEGLLSETVYEVRVRAVNADGESAWSAPGRGRTGQKDARAVRAWQARFGRTVATHVTDTVEERLRASPGEGSYLTVGGYRLPLGQRGGPDAEPGGDPLTALLKGLAGLVMGSGATRPAPGATGLALSDEDPRLGRSQTLQPLRLRELLKGSSFRLTLGADAVPGARRVTAWGRVAGTQFNGREGALSLDGDVLTGTLGVDRAWDRGLAGVAVAHSRGDGAFTGAGSRGALEHTLTSLHPYLHYAVTDRLAVWGVLGYGWGESTLAQGAGEPLATDTTWLMGAVGGRGLLLAAAEAGALSWPPGRTPCSCE